MRVTAIVPVKRFGAAKQRLSDTLATEQRALLAAAMLDDVLASLARSEAIARTLLVSGEPTAAAIATRRRVEVIDDPADRGHSEAALIGIAAAGAESVALLPGDCPLLDPDELDRLIAAVEPPAVAVIPDRHGTGTNGLILSPAEAIEPSFGPDSCERHLREARRRDVPARIAAASSLGLDLDTGADLRALQQLLAEDPDRAPATAVALRLLDLEAPPGAGVGGAAGAAR